MKIIIVCLICMISIGCGKSNSFLIKENFKKKGTITVIIVNTGFTGGFFGYNSKGELIKEAHLQIKYPDKLIKKMGTSIAKTFKSKWGSKKISIIDKRFPFNEPFKRANFTGCYPEYDFSGLKSDMVVFVLLKGNYSYIRNKNITNFSQNGFIYFYDGKTGKRLYSCFVGILNNFYSYDSNYNIVFKKSEFYRNPTITRRTLIKAINEDTKNIPAFNTSLTELMEKIDKS